MKLLDPNALDLLTQGRKLLANAGIDSAETDSELLLMAATGLERAELFAGSPPIASRLADAFLSMVERRTSREPLQYITGTAYFRKLQLRVGPGVLVPRPETEILVERALGHISAMPNPVVADICTGSGAIAISIATEYSGSLVYATDLTEEALMWARENVKVAGVTNIQLFHSDLFDSLPPVLAGNFDLVTANPPYLDDATINECPPEIRVHEPREALFGGDAGDELSMRVALDALHWLRPGGWFVMETSPRLAEDLAAHLKGTFSEVAILQDLTGRDRIVEARRPSRS